MSDTKLLAKDLRIGNLYDHNGEIRVVTPNTILEVWESKRTWCKPIPLSEDVLVKFGLIKSTEKDKLYIINSSMAVSTADNKFRFIQGNFVCQLVIREIEFVHTFQNIIHSLTGEELIYTA